MTVAALCLAIGAQAAAVCSASPASLTVGSRAATSAQRPHASLGAAAGTITATATVLPNGRLRVHLRTRAGSVQIKYVVAGRSSRSMTARVHGGAARVTLPVAATSVRVRRSATSSRRSTAWRPVPIVSSSALDQQPSPETIAAWEAELLGLVNAVRASGYTCPGGEHHGPAAALVRNPALDAAASSHSSWMAEVGRLSHRGRGGSSMGSRISTAGYVWHRAAENVAAGRPQPADTLAQWLGSKGHCRELLNPASKETGIGYAYSAVSVYRHFWTQDFAAP
jgi:uncharacterized protein YkwD